MSDKVKWAIGLIAVLAVAASTYLGVKLPQNEYEAPAGASQQVYDLTVQNNASVTGALTAGSATVTGAVSAGNSVVTGAQTVGGGYGSTGCTISTAGVLQCDGAATFGGTLTASGISQTTTILTKSADYAVLVGDTGAIIKNTAAVSATFTLPAAAAGLNYCIYNYAGTDVIIEFTDDTDVALNQVNSPGDSVTNTTAYDSICLTAIDTTNWGTFTIVGTWADGN